MIFATLTGTPCIAFDSISGKVKGVYEWIKDLEYVKFANNIEEAIKYTDILLLKRIIYLIITF